MDNNQTFLNACRNGQKGIVKIFLQKGGIDVNKRDMEGNTPLYYVCRKGNREIAGMLLANGADPTLSNNKAETPLHAVAQSGNKEIAALLLAAGADIDSADKEGCTPLIRMLDNKRTEAALFLIDRGADTTLADNQGHKAIDHATAHGLREIVSLLSGNAGCDSYGNTPLHQAVSNNQGEIVRTLLGTPGNPGVDAANDNGETPLIIAWDLVRVVNVARWTCQCGYISLEEMWQIMQTAEQTALAHFSSWEEYGRSFVLGRGVWHGEPEDCETAQEIVTTLLRSAESPWKQIPWKN